MSRWCPCHVMWQLQYKNHAVRFFGRRVLQFRVSGTAWFPWSAQWTMFTTVFDQLLGTRDLVFGVSVSTQMCVYIWAAHGVIMLFFFSTNWCSFLNTLCEEVTQDVQNSMSLQIAKTCECVWDMCEWLQETYWLFCYVCSTFSFLHAESTGHLAAVTHSMSLYESHYSNHCD